MRQTRGILAAFLVYALACSIPFLLENAGEFSQWLPDNVKNGLAWISRTYQKLIAGPRGVSSRYTALVALDQRSFPGVINDACRQRELITTLLPALAKRGPEIIVIDLAFQRDACPPDGAQSWTKKLTDALNMISAQIPVVLGKSSRDLDEVTETTRRNLLQQSFNASGLLVNAPLDIAETDRIKFGLIRTEADFRRVPLEWPAYEMNQGTALEYKGMQPSLALAAAVLARSGFPRGQDAIKAFVASTAHPYTTLLAESDFMKVKAADLLCNTSDAKQDCASAQAQAALDYLRGKIAVVAWEDDSRDLHATPAGNLPGALLQANFIESLLDSRLFKPVSFRIQVALSLVWFAMIEWPFHVWPRAVPRAFFAALGSLAVVGFVVYYVILFNAGWYLALLPPSVVALVLRSWYQWSHNQLHKPAAVSGGEGI